MAVGGAVLQNGKGFWCVGLLLVCCVSAQTSAMSVLPHIATGSNETHQFSDPTSMTDLCSEVKCCPEDSRMQIKYEVLYSQEREEHSQRKKRSVLQKICCYDSICSCNECPEKPKCKDGQLLIERSQGNMQPGSCCPVYKCDLQPKCEPGKGVNYWKDRCTKCNSCKQLCESVCDLSSGPPSNCYTYDNQLKLYGESWQESKGCTSCICNNGSVECQATKCASPPCANPKKLPNVCCPICEDDQITDAQMPIALATSPTILENTTDSTNINDIPVSATEVRPHSPYELFDSPEVEEQLDVSRDAMRFDEIEKLTGPSSNYTPDTHVIPETTDELDSDGRTDYSMEYTTPYGDYAEEASSISYAPTSDTFPSSSSSENPVSGISTFASSVGETPSRITTDSPSSSSSSSSSTSPQPDDSYSAASTSIISELPSGTEHPEYSLATSSPAAQTSESTRWHRDSPIDDSDFRYAKNQEDPRIDSNNISICLIIFILVVFIFFIIRYIIKSISCRRQPNKNNSNIVIESSSLIKRTAGRDCGTIDTYNRSLYIG